MFQLSRFVHLLSKTISLDLSSDLPVCSFSITRDADLDRAVVLLHHVAPLLSNWLLHQVTIQSNSELCAIVTGVQLLWSLPHHVATVK